MSPAYASAQGWPHAVPAQLWWHGSRDLSPTPCGGWGGVPRYREWNVGFPPTFSS